MVPVAADPLATPLTCQVTAVLVPPVTVAVNCAVPPMRVCAAPATVTMAGVTGAVGVECELFPPHPLKTNKKPVARVTVIGLFGRRKGGMLRACNDKAGMVPPATWVLAGLFQYCWGAMAGRVHPC